MGVRLSIAIFVGAIALVTGVVLAILNNQGVFDAGNDCEQTSGASYSSPGSAGPINGVEVAAVRAVRPELLPARTTAVKTHYRACGKTETVTSYALAGVDPHVALATARAGSEVLVAPGRLTRLEGFPLRDALYGGLLEPQLPKRCRSRRSILTFRHPPQADTSALLAYDSRGAVFVRIRRDTRVTGRSTFGLPEIRANDRVTVTGRSCQRPGDRTILAARIALPPS